MANEAHSSLKDTTGQSGTLGDNVALLERLNHTHQRMLREQSSIDPQIAAERGYRTVQSRSELPDFKKYQRRAPALRVPTYSPDGQTSGAQIRPDNPRWDKKGKPIKYETAGGSRIIIDVHPSMMEAVRSSLEDLWITEGIKKADSLASRGLPTIGLTGVWNWQRDGEMLPCWDHVRLDGRGVYVVYDSDVALKEGVQLALDRLVAALESRGAEVLVVHLSDAADGSKQGVDDFLAAGGRVNELKMLAGKFESAGIGEIRMSRDEKLRVAVAHLWKRWRDGDWMRFVGKADKGNWARGHTARDVMEALIELGTRNGKLDSGGVVVRTGLRRLAERSAKSAESVRKAVAHLEADGQIEILPPEGEGKARKYRLLVDRATLDSMERDTTREGSLGGAPRGVNPCAPPPPPVSVGRLRAGHAAGSSSWCQAAAWCDTRAPRRIPKIERRHPTSRGWVLIGVPCWTFWRPPAESFTLRICAMLFTARGRGT